MVRAIAYCGCVVGRLVVCNMVALVVLLVWFGQWIGYA